MENKTNTKNTKTAVTETAKAPRTYETLTHDALKAKAIVGDVIIVLPVEYLVQQTWSSSVFNNVPTDMVDVNALIEANRTIGVSWYYSEVIGEDRRVLHISIPTDKIEWED